MTTYEWDDVAYVSGLRGRPDLNNRAARVCKPTPRADGRIGVEMFIGQERVWIKPFNLTPIPNVETLSNPPFNGMSSTETTDVGMFFFANKGSTRMPGFPGRMMSTWGIGDYEDIGDYEELAPAPATAPAPAQEADEDDEDELHPWVHRNPRHDPALRRSQEIARDIGIENDVVYACRRCGAHRPMGYRCCGAYAGMNGEEPVQRRNVHDHPEADDDEVPVSRPAPEADDRERAA
jgi:hypothetical protein|tara:strand:- start:1615 stop:2319 length:705 start_codon:yes stop_codon:yes gene_type:complete